MARTVPRWYNSSSAFQLPPVQLLPVRTLRVGLRPVDQAKVQIICLKAFQRFLNAFFGLLITQVALPHLGSQKELFSRDSALPDRLSHIFLISVKRRRIQHPVAGVQGHAHHTLVAPVRTFIRSVSNARHLYSVLQDNILFHPYRLYFVKTFTIQNSAG